MEQTWLVLLVLDFLGAAFIYCTFFALPGFHNFLFRELFQGVWSVKYNNLTLRSGMIDVLGTSSPGFELFQLTVRLLENRASRNPPLFYFTERHWGATATVPDGGATA